jgi:iron complex transport system ATP-binding protein
MTTATGDALVIRSLGVTLGGRAVLEDVDLVVARGDVVGVVGPNGAGKSTLLGCIYRHTAYRSGQIRVEGQDLRTLPRKHLARLVAAVPQDTSIAFDLTVRDVVAAGRIPHGDGWGWGRADDQEIIDESLRRVQLYDLRDRSVATLSGGERQRALLGRALAQAAPILVLDEPTNHLDLAGQERLLGLIRGHGGTVVLAIHDLNLAAEHCDRLVVLADGRVVAVGRPEDVLTPELLWTVFGVRVHVVPHPESGRPLVIPRSRPTPPVFYDE